MMTHATYKQLSDQYGPSVIHTAKKFLREDKRVNEVLKNVFTTVYCFDVTSEDAINLIAVAEITEEFEKLSREFLLNYKTKV